MHSIEIKKLKKELPLTGPNCKVILDGKVLSGVTDVSFILSASGLPIISLNILAKELKVED